MEYEWDPEKNQTNLKKHGLAFENAQSVFEDFHISVEDTRKEYGEKRFITMGTLGQKERIVILAHTQRREKIRIISMRKANLREQKIFKNYVNRYRGE